MKQPPKLPLFYRWKEAVEESMLWMIGIFTMYLCLTGKQ